MRHLHNLAGGEAVRTLTDSQLLERFVGARDELAFAELVQRHGRLVRSVCRQVLRHEHDAEDAFQATFLILARKAGSIHRREAVVSWLYGVAFRTAMKARRASARRRAPAPASPPRAAESPVLEAGLRELQAILDEEVRRLPAKYQAPFLLCCLEGRSRAEAATELGWKEGTVSSRIAQARLLLEQRLARRGIALSAALCAAALGSGAAAAAVPGNLVGATVQAAVRFAQSGPAAVALRPAAALADELLKTSLRTRLQIGMALLLALGFAAAGVVARQVFAGWAGPGGTLIVAEAWGQPDVKASEQARKDRLGDPLPPGVIARLGTERLRHGGRGDGLVLFSADGQTLLSAHGDGVVHFWETATGKERRAVRTRCYCLGPGPAALAPGGHWVAFPEGNLFSVWDLASGQELHHSMTHGTTNVPCLAFSPDGKLAATGDSDGVFLWDVVTGKQLRQLQGPRTAVSGLAFSADGKVLAAKGRDGTVLLRQVADGKEVRQVAGNAGLGSDFALSPDGKLLVFGIGKSVALVDVATGKERQRLEGAEFSVHSVAFSPNRQTLAAAAGTAIHFWQTTTGKGHRTIDLGETAVGSLSFSPDGKTLAGVGTGTVVRLWDVATGQELHPDEGHRGEIRWVEFSPDGRLLATAAEDSTVRLWDPTTGRPVRVLQDQRMRPERVRFTPDGTTLFTCAANHPVLEWDVAQGQLRRRLAVQPEEPRRLQQVHTLGLSPSGRSLTALSHSRLAQQEEWLRIDWDLATGRQQVQRLPAVRGRQWPAELSPDGRRLAQPEGRAVRVYDAAGQELLTLNSPCDTIVNAAFSQDNRILAAVGLRRVPDGVTSEGQQKKVLLVWELITGQELLQAKLGDLGFTYGSPLGFSADGRLLAAGGDNPDVPVRVWDLATGKDVLQLAGHQSSVMALAFSPDGARLAGGLRNSVAQIWDVSAARPVSGKSLPVAQREQLWKDLGHEKAARAHAALWTLAGHPEQTVDLIRTHVKPVAEVEPKELGRLLADLDAESYTAREQAARELEIVGPQAARALRRALEQNPSANLRQQLEALLTAPGIARSSQTQQQLRAIQVLEVVGSPGARALLATLTTGAPLARETQAAQASLERLRSRTEP
jgi:RNA polymerase sigma factor (sigma-70 family)